MNIVVTDKRVYRDFNFEHNSILHLLNTYSYNLQEMKIENQCLDKARNTIDGKFAKMIVKAHVQLHMAKWIGRRTRDQVVCISIFCTRY